MSGRGDLKTAYLKALAEVAQGRGMSPRKPHKNYLSFAAGAPAADWRIRVAPSEGRLLVGLMLEGPTREQVFADLRACEAEMRRESGLPIEFERKNGRKRLRIFANTKLFDPCDRADWPRQHEWLCKTLRVLMEVAAPVLDRPRRAEPRSHDTSKGAGMSILLKNARLIDPEAGSETRGSLLIEDGRIKAVGDVSAPGVETIDCRGKALAPGIVDMRVFIGEPGFRHRESYRTGGQAAAAGGVTTIIAQPMTDPVIDDPAVVESIRRRADEICPVRVHVMGALTAGMHGKCMSEMGFLKDAGAVAFTDGDAPVADPIVFRRCLTYARQLGALVVHHPQEPTLSAAGCATEGFFSTKLGLPGVPAMAERMMLERDLALVELTGARYHADQLSTSAAIEVLRAAKARGLPVTASASIHHLTLNELDIGDWRSFFKFDPPLRGEDDRMALVQAVAEGVIDVVTSAHMPQDEETKRVPFEVAAHGASGLETLLSASMQLVHAGAMDLPTLFARLSTAPARLLGLEGGSLAPGAPADLVLFDPDAPYVLDRANLRARSKNTPYDLRRMEGKVIRTFVGGDQVHTLEGADA